jgi:hypothetical protein
MSGTETTEIAPRRQRGVGSLETGGAILRHLARAQAPMMLRDLADALGIRAAQLHPYMVSFREIGLVEQTERGLYALGPFALELGLSRLRSQNAYRETLRRVPALAEALDLMVAVSVWGLHGATIVYPRKPKSASRERAAGRHLSDDQHRHRSAVRCQPVARADRPGSGGRVRSQCRARHRLPIR